MAILPTEPTAELTVAVSFGQLTDEQVAAAMALLADPAGLAFALVAAAGAWCDTHADLNPTVNLTSTVTGGVTLTSTPDTADEGG